MDVAAAPKLKPDDGGKAPAADAAIEISGVSLRFETADGPVEALSDVSLRVARGEFVSFIGPSGCGKTTLLRAVADLETPTSGAIRVNGMSPGEARASRAYGYVFQAPALYPWRSVARNIALPLEIMGFDRGEREARVAKGSSWSIFPDSATNIPGNCPAACSSAPRSRGRSPSTPISCSWTSRSAPSTRSCATC